MSSDRIVGLYRAVVVDNNDPENLFRVRLRIPTLLGEAASNWAWPSVPDIATAEVPAVQKPLWVMFEGGDIEKPVWLGTWQQVPSPGMPAPTTPYVTLAGAQDIVGVKTFVANPIFNDAAIPVSKISGLPTALGSYVTLDTAQTIPGAKRFSSAATPFDGRVHVGRDADVSGWQFSVTIGDPNRIGAAVRGAVSQAADLTQWQNSAGFVALKAGLSPAVAGLTAADDGYLWFGNTGNYNVRLTTSGVGGNARLQILDGAGTARGWLVAAGVHTNAIYDTNNYKLGDTTGGNLTLNGKYSATNPLRVEPQANATGIIVQGDVGQGGNLQNWQNSAGAVLAFISSGGVWDVGTSQASRYSLHTATSYAHYTLYDDYGNGSWQVRNGVDGSYPLVLTNGGRVGLGDVPLPAGGVHSQNREATVVAHITRGAVSQTADLHQWQNAAGTFLLRVTADGTLDYGGARLKLNTGATAGVAGTRLTGAGWSPASVAGDIYLEFAALGAAGSGTAQFDNRYHSVWGIDTNGNNVVSTAHIMRLSTSGNLDIGGTGDGVARLGVTNNAAGRVGFVVRGAVSQSSDLTQWQNSAGAVVASISPSGAAFFAGGTTIGGSTVVTLDTTQTITGAKTFTVTQTFNAATNFLNASLDAAGILAVSTNQLGGAKLGAVAAGSELKLDYNGVQHWSIRNNSGVLRIGTTGSSSVLGGTLTEVLSLTGSLASFNVPLVLTNASYFLGSSTYGFRFNNNSSSLRLVTFLDNGNVTIGRQNDGADARLEVEKSHTDNNASFMRLTNPSTVGQVPLDFFINGAIRGKIRADYVGNLNWIAAGGDHVFWTGGDSGVGTARVTILAGGKVAIANAGATVDAQLQVHASSAGVVPIISRAFTGQTADLQQWMNSAGTVFGKVTAAGGLDFGANPIYGRLETQDHVRLPAGGRIYWDGDFGHYILSDGVRLQQWQTQFNASNTVAVVAKGAGANDIQQWQNSAGTVLSRVTADGSTNTAGSMRAAGGVIVGYGSNYYLRNSLDNYDIPVMYMSTNTLVVGNGGGSYAGPTFIMGGNGDVRLMPNAVSNAVVAKAGTGYVGIGTDVPGERLTVAGNTDLQGHLYLQSSAGARHIYTWSSADTNWRMGMGVDPGFAKAMLSQHVQFISYSSGSTQGLAFGVNLGNSSLEIRGSDHQAFFRGNVGIGTTAAFSKLVVSVPTTDTVTTSDATNTAGLTIAGNTSLVRLQMGVGGAALGPYGGWIQASYDNGGINNGVEPLVLNPLGGNVGIGTTAPSQALQVAGNIRVDGIVYGNSTNSYFGSTGSIGAFFSAPAASSIGLAVRAAAGQTAAIQEWQNSAGTVLSYVRSDGAHVLGLNQWVYGKNDAGGDQPLIRSRGMGYAPGTYTGIQVGQTGDGVALLIDPGSIAGGQFNGSNNEIFLPNVVTMLQANSAGTDWIAPLSISNGSMALNYLLTLGSNITMTGGGPTISTSSGGYITIPGGVYFSSNVTYFENTANFRGVIRNDVGANLTINGGTSGITLFNGQLRMNYGTAQANPLIGARYSGNAVEFGHPNQAGYGSNLGTHNNSGHPFLAFYAEDDPAVADTFKTRGIMGRVIHATTAGTLQFSRIANINLGTQAPTVDLSISSGGIANFQAGITQFTNPAGNRQFNIEASNADGLAPRLQSYNSKPLYINELGNAVYLSASGFATIVRGTLDVAGTATFTGPSTIFSGSGLQLQRSASGRSGISYYDTSFTAWATYMAPPGTGNGPQGNLTAPTGIWVTSWALRNFIEGAANYGFTWESGTPYGQPSVIAELRTSDGSFRVAGRLMAGAVPVSHASLSGDVVARRSATTGVYYFGDDVGKYLYYDAANFNLVGGGLFASGAGNGQGLTLNNVEQAPTIRMLNANTNVGSRNWAITTNYNEYGDWQIRRSAAQGGDPYAGGSTLPLWIRSSGRVEVTGLNSTAFISVTGDGYTEYGPNSTWGAYLRVGGNGWPGASGNRATVTSTNGNLHLDAGSDKNTYINFYSGTGGIQFGNGAGTTTATLSAAGVAAFASGSTVNSYAIVNTGDTQDIPGQKTFSSTITYLRRLEFLGVGGDSGATENIYSIYQRPGGWTYPYPDLAIRWHTGIVYEAYFNYGGHRFYTSNDLTNNMSFSVGDGDHNVRVTNSLYVINGDVQVGGWNLRSDGIFYPFADNTRALGGSGNRINAIHAVTTNTVALNATGHVLASGTTGTGYGAAGIEVFVNGSSVQPRISFHMGGVVASQIGMDSNGAIVVLDNPGTGLANFRAAIGNFNSLALAGGTNGTFQSQNFVTNGARFGTATTAAGSPSVSSSDLAFAAGDVGKTIGIAGAGPSGGTLNAVIIAFNNTTNVTIAVNATTTVGGGGGAATVSGGTGVGAGWRLDGGGNAQFNGNVNIRGTLDAATFTGTNFISSTSSNVLRSINYLAGSTGWSIDGAGYAEFGNVTVRGNITSSTINSTQITGTGITVGVAPNNVSMDINGLYAGNAVWGSAPFRVSLLGALTATNATITGAITGGSSITINNGANQFAVDSSGNLWLGATSFGAGPFRVSNAGALTATNAVITGAITGSSSITINNGANQFAVDSSGNLWLGATTFGAAPFRVSNAGALTANNVNITGGSLSIGANFSVTNTGLLTATGGSFTGAVTATSGSFTGAITAQSGTIGGFTIGTSLTGAGTISGGTFETAASGARIRLSSANAAYVRLYSAAAGESDSAFINIGTDGSLGIGSSKINGGNGNVMLNFSPQILNNTNGTMTSYVQHNFSAGIGVSSDITSNAYVYGHNSTAGYRARLGEIYGRAGLYTPSGNTQVEGSNYVYFTNSNSGKLEINPNGYNYFYTPVVVTAGNSIYPKNAGDNVHRIYWTSDYIYAVSWATFKTVSQQWDQSMTPGWDNYYNRNVNQAETAWRASAAAGFNTYSDPGVKLNQVALAANAGLAAVRAAVPFEFQWAPGWNTEPPLTPPSYPARTASMSEGERVALEAATPAQLAYLQSLEDSRAAQDGVFPTSPNVQSNRRVLGLASTDLPNNVTLKMGIGNYPNAKGIDLGALVALLWGAARDLDALLTAATARIAALEARIPPLP